jgi:hypothetical protein
MARVDLPFLISDLLLVVPTVVPPSHPALTVQPFFPVLLLLHPDHLLDMTIMEKRIMMMIASVHPADHLLRGTVGVLVT